MACAGCGAPTRHLVAGYLPLCEPCRSSVKADRCDRCGAPATGVVFTLRGRAFCEKCTPVVRGLLWSVRPEPVGAVDDVEVIAWIWIGQSITDEEVQR